MNLDISSVADFASLISLPAAVISTVAFLRRPGAGRKLILYIATPLAIAAYTIDISDRLGWIRWSERGNLADMWGQRDGAFYVVVNSQLLLRYKDSYKMVLIIYVPYANVDKFTDTTIEKSGLFTITESPTNIAIQVRPRHHLRISPPPESKLGDTFEVIVNYVIGIVPNILSAEQIKSLCDVQTLGGKVLTTLGSNAKFTTFGMVEQNQGG